MKLHDELDGQLAEPLLQKRLDEHVPKRLPSSFYRRHVYLLIGLIFNLLFLLSNVVFALSNAHGVLNSYWYPSTLRLPASDAIVWEWRRLDMATKESAAFRGEPRPELDMAWHNLLRNDNIRLPKTDVDALNLTSVYLKDNGDAAASLSVFHSLHCLKKVRQMIHREIYHLGKSPAQMEREELHVDHCVEYIRQILMCKPDLSLITFRWINHTTQLSSPSELGPTNFDAGEHECANWEALNRWAGERAIDLFDLDALRKPEHGMEYERPSS